MTTTCLPSWLNGLQLNREPSGEISLAGPAGTSLFEIWYCGELCKVKGEPQLYIVADDTHPLLIEARSIDGSERHVIFDGLRHGYNAMFCDSFDPEAAAHRPMVRYDHPAASLVLETGHGIDYEDEKEDYEIDDNGMVTINCGDRISWDQVKTDGIDWLAIYMVDSSGKRCQIVSLELA